MSDRKQRGAWYTPIDLVERVVAAVVDAPFVGARRDRVIRVLDPACGDGRFLAAVERSVRALGAEVVSTGVDIDADALDSARRNLPHAEFLHADALSSPVLAARRSEFDIVIGNPPFLSQMAAATSRRGASGHGGGPYADAAVEFLALAADLVDPDGGRVAFVLPQSVLSGRDGRSVRLAIDRSASMIWSSWTGVREFDADVFTCALAFEFGHPHGAERDSWAHVVNDRIGVPDLPLALVGGAASGQLRFDDLARIEPSDCVAGGSGTLGDRAWLNANFRDEYYGMIPAVGDHPDGPPLITSGSIDPGCSLWGTRPVRFAKQHFIAPRVDLDLLDTKMRAWADRRLIPKVLVANQTSILEAVCDPTGAWLPGVPVVAVYPHGAGRDAARTAWEIAAVLTSPAASIWAWHQRAGTGLSAGTIRVGPAMLADLPWPGGGLDDAIHALQAGAIRECGEVVDAAYGLDDAERNTTLAWWLPTLERIERRRAHQARAV